MAYGLSWPHQVTLSDSLPRVGTVRAAPLAKRNSLSLTFLRKHMVIIKSKPTFSQVYYRVKFSADMFHSTLGMPRNKEQVENRLSKVRNQSSILVPDGQDVVLVVMVTVFIHACAHVHTEIWQHCWRVSPLGPKPCPTLNHCSRDGDVLPDHFTTYILTFFTKKLWCINYRFFFFFPTLCILNIFVATYRISSSFVKLIIISIAWIYLEFV